jgi:hypothetical protein
MLQPNWIEPKLSAVPIPLDVDVRRFAVISGVEEHPVRI